MNILVFKDSFDKTNPDQPVYLTLGNCVVPGPKIELTKAEEQAISNAIYSAINAHTRP